MVDTFASQADSKISPASNAFEITPDDTTDLAYSTRGLYVSQVADVRVDMHGSGTITWPDLIPGVMHALRVKRVYATGTSPGVTIIGAY
jgi:hypothetical protein